LLLLGHNFRSWNPSKSSKEFGF